MWPADGPHQQNAASGFHLDQEGKSSAGAALCEPRFRVKGTAERGFTTFDTNKRSPQPPGSLPMLSPTTPSDVDVPLIDKRRSAVRTPAAFQHAQLWLPSPELPFPAGRRRSGAPQPGGRARVPHGPRGRGPRFPRPRTGTAPRAAARLGSARPRRGRAPAPPPSRPARPSAPRPSALAAGGARGRRRRERGRGGGRGAAAAWTRLQSPSEPRERRARRSRRSRARSERGRPEPAGAAGSPAGRQRGALAESPNRTPPTPPPRRLRPPPAKRNKTQPRHRHALPPSPLGFWWLFFGFFFLIYFFFYFFSWGFSSLLPDWLTRSW